MKTMYFLLAFIFGCLPGFLSSCNVTNGVLDLSESNIQGHIDVSLFGMCNANHYDIEDIDLSGNSITGVDPGTFVTFYNVRIINLSTNEIAELNKTTFTSLTKLEELDLSYNLLTKLEAGLFDLFHLRKLYLHNNVISEIETGIVSDKNENLYYVNLNNNSLTTFEPWPYLTKITDDRSIERVFDIQYNNITNITNTMAWVHDLTWPFQVFVNLQYNNINHMGSSVISQLKPDTNNEVLFTTFLAMNMNVTSNPYFCSCDLFDFAKVIHSGAFLWAQVDSYRYRCSEPSMTSGIDWFHDLALEEFVCNITIDCPSGCFCQDRPHNDTFFINCTDAGLTEIPASIPAHNRSKIEIFLDNNRIQSLSNVSYINQIYNLSLSNNLIESLNTSIIKALPSDSHLNLRSNRISELPRDIQRFSYENVQVRDNPLQCDCNSMWLSEWVQLYRDSGDTGVTCTSKEGVHTLIDISLEELGCISESLLVLWVCIPVVVTLVVAVLAFSRICPYEAKVILHRLFRFHPWDKYRPDNDTSKDVDIYLIFDWDDVDAVGWVKDVFIKKLQKRKHIYSVLNPYRFTEGGPESNNHIKWIGKSRRVIIVLSEKLLIHNPKGRSKAVCFESDVNIDDESEIDVEVEAKSKVDAEWILHMIDTAENYITEAQSSHATEDGVCGPESIENGYVKTAAKVIYIIHNKHSNILANKIKEEPWKSRLTGKTVLKWGQRMFWSKLRYELPKKGRGTGPDGNFVIPRNKQERFDNEQQSCSYTTEAAAGNVYTQDGYTGNSDSDERVRTCIGMNSVGAGVRTVHPNNNETGRGMPRNAKGICSNTITLTIEDLCNDGDGDC